MKVGHLDDGEFGGKAQIHVIFGRDQMVVLIEADNADNDLHDHQDWNHKELGLQRLVVEESHAQKCTDRAADPSPEEQGFLGYAALAFFGAGFIYTIKEERDKVNEYEPVNEYHKWIISDALFLEESHEGIKAFNKIIVGLIEIIGIPWIGNASAASGKGQELVDLAVGISACKACHVRDIIRIHADQVIVMLIVGACHLARAVRNDGNAHGAQFAHGAVVRTIADLLTARCR